MTLDRKDSTTLETQWNECEGGCDGFDCKFALDQKLPFEVLDHETGNGSYGTVKKVQSHVTGEVLAVKEQRWNPTQGEDKRDTIVRELRTHRRLHHRHISRAIGTYVRKLPGQSKFGIVMAPFAQCDLGIFLNRIVENRASNVSVIGEIDLLKGSLGCLASGLSYLHGQKVKHKDIKPGNILVHEGTVLLTDFGLSRDFSDIDQSTSSGQTACTKKYAAPEVLRGTSRNRAADIFSLGCVFLEILTVLEKQSLSELKRTPQTAAGVAYGENKDARLQSLAKIFTGSYAGQIKFFTTLENMLSERVINRPTAGMVWEAARSTPRDGRNDVRGLCGQCCQFTAIIAAEHEEEMSSKDSCLPDAQVPTSASGEHAVNDPERRADPVTRRDTVHHRKDQEMLDCPKPDCPRRGENGFARDDDRKRHVFDFHL